MKQINVYIERLWNVNGIQDVIAHYWENFSEEDRGYSVGAIKDIIGTIERLDPKKTSVIAYTHDDEIINELHGRIAYCDLRSY